MTPRIALLCAGVAGLLAACTSGSGPERRQHSGSGTIATFEGEYDPQTGVMSLRTTPDAGLLAAVVLPAPVSDGAPGSGPDNTFELVTEPSPQSPAVAPPGVVVDGCSPGVNSFEGSITLRSFFVAQTFSNVYLQLTEVSPSGHEACNSVTGGGLANNFGLWSYGSLGTKGAANSAATVLWKFKYPNSQRFTFRGRIMGDWVNPPEFNWIPSYVNWAPARFQDTATTIGHIVWNPTARTFEDTSRGITFVPHSTLAPDNAINLWSPAHHYGGPFPQGVFYVADAAHGANNIDTSGTFTACAKFKPGLMPWEDPVPNETNEVNKIIIGKGQAEGTAPYEGWALMEMHLGYCFHYSINSAWTMTWHEQGATSMPPITTSPSTWVYDYFCGGRNGNVIYGAAHGRDGTIFPYPVTGSMVTYASLPLVIGAYPDGTAPLYDGGVYEVIFDSRPPTDAVMLEIVEAAEADLLPGSTSAIYVPPVDPLVSAPAGSIPAGQRLPPHATTPLPDAASGMLQQGLTVQYKHPLAENTSNTGFCAGILLTANGAWSAVQGGLLDFPQTVTQAGFKLSIPFASGRQYLNFNEPVGAFWNQTDITTSTAGWAAGSTHTIKVCAEPYSADPVQHTYLYLDGNLVGTSEVRSAIPNLSDPSHDPFEIGATNGTTLSGARIRRVFMCPTAVAANCN